MNILYNGAPRDVAGKITLKEVLALESCDRPGVAAALNDHLVPRGRWEGTPLIDGDEILVIEAAQGG